MYKQIGFCEEKKKPIEKNLIMPIFSYHLDFYFKKDAFKWGQGIKKKKLRMYINLIFFPTKRWA